MSVFLRLLTYVRRTILRARARTLLTVLGTALAMGLFAFVHMLEAGVDRLAESSDQPVLVVFQSSRFCPLTSQLPMRYKGEIERMEGVESVLPTLLFINSCRANLDLVTLHGVEPEGVDAIHSYNVLDGSAENWGAQRDGALIGRRLAERRRLGVGDRVRLGNVDIRVAGIIDSEGGGLDNLAFVDLEHLQLARDLQGVATQFMISVEPGTDVNALAARIDEHFASDEQATDTKTMQAFVQGAVGEVSEVVGFARILGYLAVAVVVLILGNTVYISAQTRTTELGVMETLGVTRTMLSGLVLIESVSLSIVGGFLGIGVVAAWLLASPKTLGIEGWGIDIAPDASLVVTGLLLSLLVGVVAAIGPALHTARRSLSLAVQPE